MAISCGKNILSRQYIHQRSEGKKFPVACYTLNRSYESNRNYYIYVIMLPHNTTTGNILHLTHDVYLVRGDGSIVDFSKYFFARPQEGIRFIFTPKDRARA